MLTLLLALATTSLAFSKSNLPAQSITPAKKSQVLEQLHKTCVKNSFQEGKNQEAACDCLKANYDKRFSEEALHLLARIQAGTVAKDELEGNDDLLEFDMEASQHCVEDSAWRWVPEAKAKAKEGDESVDEEKPATEVKAKPAVKAKPTPKPKATPKKKN